MAIVAVYGESLTFLDSLSQVSCDVRCPAVACRCSGSNWTDDQTMFFRVRLMKATHARREVTQATSAAAKPETFTSPISPEGRAVRATQPTLYSLLFLFGWLIISLSVCSVNDVDHPVPPSAPTTIQNVVKCPLRLSCCSRDRSRTTPILGHQRPSKMFHCGSPENDHASDSLRGTGY